MVSVGFSVTRAGEQGESAGGSVGRSALGWTTGFGGRRPEDFCFRLCFNLSREWVGEGHFNAVQSRGTAQKDKRWIGGDYEI